MRFFFGCGKICGFSIRRESANSSNVITFYVVCCYFIDTSIILRTKEKGQILANTKGDRKISNSTIYEK